MHKVLFIESASLGLLEPMLVHMSQGITKKQRASKLQHVCEVLRHTDLIERKADVHGVALGVQRDGTRGLYVVLNVPDHVIAARSAEPLGDAT